MCTDGSTTNLKHTAKNPYEKAGGEALDAVFLSGLKSICVACADMSLVFFDSTGLEMEDASNQRGGASTKAPGAGAGSSAGSGARGGAGRMLQPRVQQRTHISTSQRMLAWCGQTNTLCVARWAVQWAIWVCCCASCATLVLIASPAGCVCVCAVRPQALCRYGLRHPCVEDHALPRRPCRYHRVQNSRVHAAGAAQ